MSAANRFALCFAVVFPVLFITGSCKNDSAEERKANATARLKELFESSTVPDATEICRLIDAGADVDVNVKVIYAGRLNTPLRVAKMMGHTQVVKLLKEHGAKE